MHAQLSDTFLVDLQAVLNSQAAHITGGFLADLKKISHYAGDADATVQPYELEKLSSVLNDWRARCTKSADEYMAHLSDDDPLKEPVSLFGTMDYGRLEVAHTRTLGWLITPGASHGFGSKLLEALLGRVVQRSWRIIPETTIVHTEWSNSTSTTAGRLDILAHGKWVENDHVCAWAFAIEAKISSSETPKQLTRYEQMLEAAYPAPSCEVVRLYLTRDGTDCTSHTAQWHTLSFLELAKTLRTIQGLKGTPGYHFLRYYLAGVLHDICGLARAEHDNPYERLHYLKTATQS